VVLLKEANLTKITFIECVNFLRMSEVWGKRIVVPFNNCLRGLEGKCDICEVKVDVDVVFESA
jgi:hypothetical protein